MRQTRGTSMTYNDFLREVTATYRDIEQRSGKPVTHYLPGPPLTIGENEDAVEISLESQSELASAIGLLPADERLAVQLFVVDELPAEKVASIVGWPNAKSVYNRVHRALARVRHHLENRGIDRANT
jgi:DNA-directed RNA polymerase specialized sigma24 family protein